MMWQRRLLAFRATGVCPPTKSADSFMGCTKVSTHALLERCARSHRQLSDRGDQPRLTSWTCSPRAPNEWMQCCRWAMDRLRLFIVELEAAWRKWISTSAHWLN